MIDQRRIERLARTLIDARNDNVALGPLGPDLVPVSLEEASAVDDLVAIEGGWPLQGWKIGCTSEHAQQMLGADGPFAGRVYTLYEGDTTLAPGAMAIEPKMEGEFAFTLGSDLPARAGGYDRAEVVAAVANLRPSIEIVGGRYSQFVGAPLMSLIADAGANCLVVVGDPISNDGSGWDSDALAEVAATMTVDGEVTGEGVGGHVLGDPLNALMWLANHLSGRGIDLSAGQVVTTGTATQVSALPVGSTATNTIEGLGSVSVIRS